MSEEQYKRLGAAELMRLAEEKVSEMQHLVKSIMASLKRIGGFE